MVLIAPQRRYFGLGCTLVGRRWLACSGHAVSIHTHIMEIFFLPYGPPNQSSGPWFYLRVFHIGPPTRKTCKAQDTHTREGPQTPTRRSLRPTHTKQGLTHTVPWDGPFPLYTPKHTTGCCPGQAAKGPSKPNSLRGEGVSKGGRGGPTCKRN